MSFRIIHGDALEELARLPAESVDSMVTDPPAGISFMSKTWDHDHGGRQEWVTSFSAIFAESLRVLKPGAHALVWAIPRTSHWTATALEDAGFEIREKIYHLFGTGFPKSHSVSKAIDKAAGAEREPTGETRMMHTPTPCGNYDDDGYEWGDKQQPVTAPATEAARTWEGWGTALKPSAEEWILCRKPLIGTIAGNVIEHGTGAINVDGCRIGFASAGDEHEAKNKNRHADFDSGPRDNKIFGADERDRGADGNYAATGRWPANVVLSHSEGCELAGERKVATGIAVQRNGGGQRIFKQGEGLTRTDQGYGDADGLETVPAYRCVESCPVRMLDEQSGELHGHYPKARGKGGIGQDGHAGQDGPEERYTTGAASRFFYCSKPSTRERDIGGVTNRHPTVKSAELMAYFCRLVTPPFGTVLDPFMGSGSTGIAALREGFEFIGIEREAEYVELARNRIHGDAPLLNQEAS